MLRESNFFWRILIAFLFLFFGLQLNSRAAQAILTTSSTTGSGTGQARADCTLEHQLTTAIRLQANQNSQQIEIPVTLKCSLNPGMAFGFFEVFYCVTAQKKSNAVTNNPNWDVSIVSTAEKGKFRTGQKPINVEASFFLKPSVSIINNSLSAKPYNIGFPFSLKLLLKGPPGGAEGLDACDSSVPSTGLVATNTADISTSLSVPQCEIGFDNGVVDFSSVKPNERSIVKSNRLILTSCAEGATRGTISLTVNEINKTTDDHSLTMFFLKNLSKTQINFGVEHPLWSGIAPLQTSEIFDMEYVLDTGTTTGSFSRTYTFTIDHK